MAEKSKKTAAKSKNNSQGAREQVVLALIKHSYQAGPMFITLDKLSQISGLSIGAIRYHFEDITGPLFEAGFEYVLKHSYQFIEEQTFLIKKQGAYDPIETYIEIMFNWIEKYPEESSFLFFYFYLGTTNSNYSTHQAASNERAQLRLQSYLFESMGLGKIPSVQDPVGLSKIIHSAIVGAGQMARVAQSKEELESYKLKLKLMVQKLLN